MLLVVWGWSLLLLLCPCGRQQSLGDAYMLHHLPSVHHKRTTSSDFLHFPPHGKHLERLTVLCATPNKKKPMKYDSYDVEELLENLATREKPRFSSLPLPAKSNQPANFSVIGGNSKALETDTVTFPEFAQNGLDEKAIRNSPFGKLLFGVLDTLFPVFKEPNWFDVYDPPLSTAENLELPYFDGYDFANSSWTVYIRHRYGAWNWLDRFGLVPQATHRLFFNDNGKTTWSDGYYGDWFLNPAINYLQFEKHFGRGYGVFQAARGIRIFQVQRWHYEASVGRYWQRGLRSILRNESNFYALEGRIWGAAVGWRSAPRDQGKFVAIRDNYFTATHTAEASTNVNSHNSNSSNLYYFDTSTKSHNNSISSSNGKNNVVLFPWETRFRHAMSLPFYQAHPDQLERIEDNFDMFYRNLLGPDVR